MNIVLVSNLFPNPVENCRGMFNFHIARHLADLENRVTVVSPLPYFPGFWPLRFLERWYRFSQVPDRAVYGRVIALYPKYPLFPKFSDPVQATLMFPFLYRALKQIQTRHRIDIVNAHYLYPDGAAACRACHLLGIPVVISALGTDVNVLARHPSLGRQIRDAISMSSAVTAVSRDLGKKLEDFGLDREVQVLANGVDLSLFRPLDRRSERRRTGIPEEDPVILYVGRLSAEKGIDFLLQAAASLRRTVPRLRLLIIGDGPEMHRLRAAASEVGGQWIQFLGEQGGEAINRWLAVCDLFCLPSIREGCPNVILESFAAGRPVVGSRVGGIPELIQEGVNGLMSRPADPADLAEKLRCALLARWDPVQIRCGVQSRSWSAVAQRYLDLYLAVLGHPERQPAAGQTATDATPA